MKHKIDDIDWVFKNARLVLGSGWNMSMEQGTLVKDDLVVTISYTGIVDTTTIHSAAPLDRDVRKIISEAVAKTEAYNAVLRKLEEEKGKIAELEKYKTFYDLYKGLNQTKE